MTDSIEALTEFLQQNPWSTCMQISLAVDVPSTTLRRWLSSKFQQRERSGLLQYATKGQVDAPPVVPVAGEKWWEVFNRLADEETGSHG